MMEGIEVLSTATVYSPGPGVILGAIIFGLFAVMCIAIAIICIHDAEYGSACISAIFTIFSLLGTYGCIIGYVNRVPHEEYKVTISDSVKVNEFQDKYIILSKEGKIYTIKEKETTP